MANNFDYEDFDDDDEDIDDDEFEIEEDEQLDPVDELDLEDDDDADVDIEIDNTNMCKIAKFDHDRSILYPNATKFEVTAAIAWRACQIAEGAMPNVTEIDDTIPIKQKEIRIAIAEYKQHKLPIDILRHVNIGQSKKQYVCSINDLRHIDSLLHF
jgi:DNA-directed RNA polymerase subunit K/omega